MSVRHVVIWNLVAETGDKPAVIAQMQEKLHGLVGVIPGLRSLEVAGDLGDTEANWDVVLISEHDSAQALEDYQQHPAHLEVAGWVKQHVSARAAVDYSRG